MTLFGITFGWQVIAIITTFFVGRLYQHGSTEIKKKEQELRALHRTVLKKLAGPNAQQGQKALSSPRIVSRPDLQAMTAYNEESDRNGTFERPWLASSGCELTDQIWIACERAGVDCDFVTPFEQMYADDHGFEDVRALRLFLGEEIQ